MTRAVLLETIEIGPIMSNAFIHFDKVSKVFGIVTVVDDLELAIAKGRVRQPAWTVGFGKKRLFS